MSILETAAISVTVGVLSRLSYSVLVNIISGWLTERQRAFFKHYKDRHPVKSPRACLIDYCAIIPPPVHPRPPEMPES